MFLALWHKIVKYMTEWLLCLSNLYSDNHPPPRSDKYTSSWAVNGFRKFSDVPIEIILEIAEYLPAHNVASLAFTCKDLHQNELLRQKWRPGLRKHKNSCLCPQCKNSSRCFAHFGLKNHECLFFRHLLAKDITSKTHCDIYRRCHEKGLQMSDSTARISEQPHSLKCRKKGAPQLGIMQWPLWDVEFGFDDVQQVMRRQTWGSAHGASLKSVVVSKDWKTVQMNPASPGEVITGKWFRKFDLRPKIVSGVIVLHACHRLFIGKEFFAGVDTGHPLNGKLVADVVKRDFQICQGHSCEFNSNNSNHLHKIIEYWMGAVALGVSPRDQHCRYLPVAREIGVPADSPHHPEVIECHRPYWCGSCLTNWSINMYGHRTCGIQIVLDSWTNIGACRVPYSLAWSIASRDYGKVCVYLPANNPELQYPQYILDTLYVSSSVVRDPWETSRPMDSERSSDSSAHALADGVDQQVGESENDRQLKIIGEKLQEVCNLIDVLRT